MVESKEDGTKKGDGFKFVGIGLEIRMDVDDKGGTDGSKKAGLQE